MVIIGPALGVGAGTIGAGAAFGGAMSFWTCDQSENGFLRPSLDLDASCVATEIALGAVFAPVAGAAGAVKNIVPKIAVACGWGAVEGATSTIAHMTFVDEEEAFDASDALVGAGVGCATAGVLEGAFARFFRNVDDVVPEVRAPELSPWTLGWSSRGLAIEDALGGTSLRTSPRLTVLQIGWQQVSNRST